MKLGSSHEEIATFWSNASAGLTVRELLHLSPEIKLQMAHTCLGPVATQPVVELSPDSLSPNIVAA